MYFAGIVKINELDIDPKFISEHFNLIQAIFSGEIEAGELNDAYGSDIAEGYVNSLW